MTGRNYGQDDKADVGNLRKAGAKLANDDEQKEPDSQENPVDQAFSRINLYPQRDSNPRIRTENPTSWASRRWGRMTVINGVGQGLSSTSALPPGSAITNGNT